MSTTVETFVEQTKLFLRVNLVGYIKEVSEKAGEKAGDLVDAAKIAAGDLVAAGEIAAHKVGEKAGELVDAAKVATILKIILFKVFNLPSYSNCLIEFSVAF